MMYAKILLLVLAVVLSMPASVMARGGGLAPAINAGRARRQAIRSMPIHHRPSRPGHFYGNTVRRRARNGR